MEDYRVTADDTNTFYVNVGHSTDRNKYRGYNSGKTFYINGIENPILQMEPDISYKFVFLTKGHPFFISNTNKGGTPENPVNVVGYEEGTYMFAPLGNDFDKLFYACTRYPWMGNEIEIMNNIEIVSEYKTKKRGRPKYRLLDIEDEQ